MDCLLSLSSLIFIISFLIFLLLLLVTRQHASTNASPTPCYGFIPFYRNRGRLLDWFTDLLASSPSQTIVIDRLGARRTVITANPLNVEHILKANFHNYPKGKPFTDILGDLLGRGIFNSDGDLWLSQRRVAAHEFTARSLRSLVSSALRSEADRRLVPHLTSAADSGRPVDLQDLLRRFAFDVICNITLGTDLGLLAPGASLPVSPFAEAFDVASAVSAQRGAAPLSAAWKAKRALRIGSERRLRHAVGLIHETVTGLIKQRRECPGGGADMLTRLVAVSGNDDDQSIRDMAISFVMAGRDTTSSALTWFFWLVSRHPEVEAGILRELFDIMSTKSCSGTDVVDYGLLKELKYLEACLYESMRLYPPVVWDSKHAAGPDVLPDGTRVGRGDRVTYFPYGMGRMGSIWGEDWAEFRPERWLQPQQQPGRVVSAYKYPVFQAGPRVCLGREMAMVQMKYVAAAVLARFEVRTADDGTSPAVVPLLTAHMAGGLKVVLARRRNDILFSESTCDILN